MNLLRRNKAAEEDTIPLILTGKNGEPWMEFPGEVAASVRQAITRIMRTTPFPEKLVTISAVRQEGTTYISRAMGAVMAKDSGQRICTVELNWWWPADYPDAISGRPGIAEVLLGQATLEEIMINTGMVNLTLVPAGKLPKNLRSTVVHSEELSAIVATLEKQFDHVILDLPAVTATSDAIILASLGTAICLIVLQGVTPMQQVRMALDDLDHLNIIGVIMNQVSLSTPRFVMNYLAQK